MKLKPQTSYESPFSDLRFFIAAIFSEQPNYYKVKARISNKRNGIVYETKTMKLDKDLISGKNWEQV